MSPRRLQLRQALQILPEVDELRPLRGALIGGSHENPHLAPSRVGGYATLDTRRVDAAELERRIPEIADEARARSEQLLRHSLEAVQAVQRGDWAAAARALVAAGELEERAYRLDSAERCFEKAFELGRKPRDRSAEGLALRRLARIARSRGQLDRAMEMYLRSHRIAEAMRDVEGQVVACQGLGNVCVDRGLWSDARRWYRRGLERVDTGFPSRDLWLLQNNLAIVARRQGRLDESREWIAQAERTLTELSDREGWVLVLTAKGLLRVAEGSLPDAEETYSAALTYAATPSERALVLVNLAECVHQGGRWDEAEGLFREVEEISVAYGLLDMLPHAYRGLGAVARSRDLEDGFLFYEQALELCRAPGAPLFELALTQLEYGKHEARFGRVESAIARFHEAADGFRALGAESEWRQAQDQILELQAELVEND